MLVLAWNSSILFLLLCWRGGSGVRFTVGDFCTRLTTSGILPPIVAWSSRKAGIRIQLASDSAACDRVLPLPSAPLGVSALRGDECMIERDASRTVANEAKLEVLRLPNDEENTDPLEYLRGCGTSGAQSPFEVEERG